MNPFVKCLYLLLPLVMLAAGHEACAGSEPSPGATAKPAPKAVQLSGKVAETMDGGGYTYVLLKNGAEKVWVAIPLMKVTVGQELALIPGYEIRNFTSKGLNRKFERVVFSAGVADTQVKLSPAAIKMAHQGVPMPNQPAPAAQPASGAKPAPAVKLEKPRPISIEQIAKAKGPNSYTIAQLYAKQTKLEKKPVVVRGRIVKVSPRILKRNWIHIQDGSGTEAKKNNNLIVTSKELPKVGDLVTVKGTLYNNMDFGSGYRYGLLVEGARFNR
ncbi:MAG: DNA-binding protein [Geobacteraceae bacterium GWC2_58_44]|nr:MAG: DNA-binding protein [Geobacteraceae bacterium GWC2_58_44]HBG05306.1 DNA-binding protein [Geobacter sp.]